MINDIGLSNEFVYSRATEIKCCSGLFLSKSAILRLILVKQWSILFSTNQTANILYISDNNKYLNIKEVILSRG